MNFSSAFLALAFLGLTATLATAEQFEGFTYKVNEDDTVAITSYTRDIVGHVEIPAGIEGRSVTTIGGRAFYNCTGLTSIFIPNSITDIPAYAFDGCTSLAEIDVDPQNSDYASEDGVLFNRNRTELIRCPEGKSGSYSVPDGITGIDHLESTESLWWWVSASGHGSAFSGCSRLTSITIPESITALHQYTFRGCTALNSLIIVGVCPHFRIDNLCTETPEIFGTEKLVVPGNPPVPQVSGGRLSVCFDPTFRGFGYRVETSRDLVHWTTDGVILSEIDPDGQVNASVAIDGPARYLRLVPYITNWTHDGSSTCLG